MCIRDSWNSPDRANADSTGDAPLAAQNLNTAGGDTPAFGGCLLYTSFVGYIIAGFTKSALISLPVTIVLMVAVLFIIRSVVKKNDYQPDKASE